MLKKVIKNVRKVISFILTLITFLILLTLLYYKKNFSDVSFEQLVFSILSSEGTSMGAVSEGIIFVVVFLLVSLFGTYFGMWLLRRHFNDVVLRVKFCKKEFNISLVPLNGFIVLLLNISFFCLSVYYALDKIGYFEFLYFQNTSSNIFEEYYVDPKEVKLTFPKNKKNLIYIYVESLETSYVSDENGGKQDKSYIPKLEELALNNINFSNTDKLGGALCYGGSGWTIGAMVAHTAGVPLKLPLDEGNLYGITGESVPGAYSIAEILSDNGYKNYFLMGSDGNFAGRKNYLLKHGFHEVYDYYTAIEKEWIPSDYYEWWGIEDKTLFEIAKENLTEISRNDEPFYYSMITTDTHFIDGYLEDNCPLNFDDQYSNVLECNDSMVNKFIKWISKQDFYKDTVVVVVGDHHTMQPNFYPYMDKTRTIFNAYINTDIKTDYSKNREFISMDYYPTTLAALNVKIEGDRLGLGTNLFSGKKTLTEELGYENYIFELDKKSFYYDNVILGETYYDLEY